MFEKIGFDGLLVIAMLCVLAVGAGCQLLPQRQAVDETGAALYIDNVTGEQTTAPSTNGVPNAPFTEYDTDAVQGLGDGLEQLTKPIPVIGMLLSGLIGSFGTPALVNFLKSRNAAKRKAKKAAAVKG